MGHPVRAVRPRYSRITAAGSAVMVTAVAVLGGLGVLPTAPSAEAVPVPGTPSSGPAAILARATTVANAPFHLRRPEQFGARTASEDPDSAELALPEESGTGRRVVFDMSRQRVWLVAGREHVVRTYPVSGSLTDNLQPGTYEVYSKSRDAVGIDDSGTMKFMVRFAYGRRAAIGFHDIPVREGERVQTRAQLGTPQSHGCIRQLRKDARALWKFAPIGTTVVVVR